MGCSKQSHTGILPCRGTLLPMHEFTPQVEALADEILAYNLHGLKSDPPLDRPLSERELLQAGR